jgi:hypothetical protein
MMRIHTAVWVMIASMRDGSMLQTCGCGLLQHGNTLAVQQNQQLQTACQHLDCTLKLSEQ